MEENELNEVMEEEVVLSKELEEKINAKVAALKEENPKLKVIFPIVVKGEEYDTKEMFIGYFRQPDFKTFSKYLTAVQRDSAVGMLTLAKDCFLDGDRDLVDNDSLFLFGTMGQLNKIISMRQGRLVNLSKTRK